MSVLNVNLSSQDTETEKQLLQLELDKYKNRCSLLENELRETLSTVKVISDQLEAANREKKKEQEKQIHVDICPNR